MCFPGLGAFPAHLFVHALPCITLLNLQLSEKVCIFLKEDELRYLNKGRNEH